MYEKFYLNFGQFKFVNESFNGSIKRVSFITQNLNNFKKHAKSYELILNTFLNAYISKLEVTIKLSIEDTVNALFLNKIKCISYKSNQKDSFTLKCTNLIIQA